MSWYLLNELGMSPWGRGQGKCNCDFSRKHEIEGRGKNVVSGNGSQAEPSICFSATHGESCVSIKKGKPLIIHTVCQMDIGVVMKN